MNRFARRILVLGRVQGVGYRYWAIDAARRLGLCGWVRNRRDGSVEILCVGAEAAVEDFTRSCAEGPPAARVIEIVSHPARDDGAIGFESKPTL